MKKNIIVISVLFFIIFSVLPLPVSSQGFPIGVGGYVTSGGVPVDGASVQIWNENNDETVYTTTNSYGKYGKALTGESSDNITVIARKGTKEGIITIIVDISQPTQWANVTIKTQGGGGPSEQPPGETNPPLPVNGSPPEIPPPQPPRYPDFPAPVAEMYDLLKIMSLPVSDKKIIVMVIDTGAQSKTVEAFMDPDMNKTVDLSKISLRFNSKYFKSGVDENGHGTFTNYEIAYILQTKCTNAVQISYRVIGASRTSESDVFLDGLKQAETIHPDVVSISIGAPGNPNDPFSKEVEKLRGMGIIVVVAAGNYGWNKLLNQPASSTITSPALSDGAICVGAFDWGKTVTFADDKICQWSSRGPVAGVPPPKPDVVAPGESIAGVGLTPYAVSSGTSFACPLIAGGTAVVLANTKDQADLIKSLYFWDGGTVPRAFEESLRESCISKGNQDDWGAGIPQFDKALTIFKNKLNTLLYEFIGLVAFIVILLGAGVIYYRKSKAKPWWKK